MCMFEKVYLLELLVPQPHKRTVAVIFLGYSFVPLIFLGPKFQKVVVGSRHKVRVVGQPHLAPLDLRELQLLFTLLLVKVVFDLHTDKAGGDQGDQDEELEQVLAESHYSKSSQKNLYLNIKLKWPISLCRWLHVSICLDILCHISLGTCFVWNAQATPKVPNRCRAANKR